jgi:hypothetical protein
MMNGGVSPTNADLAAWDAERRVKGEMRASIQEMLDRIDALEAEVAEMKKRIG